jgi:hypothetical protein
MNKVAIAPFGICLLLFSTVGRTSPLEDIIESTFRPAIVKIDVSSNTPVIKDNVNICQSEGTGFLVSSSHVVTAEHVYALAPECGERIIIVKSNVHSLQKLASIVAAKNDVALLRVDSNFTADMCVLAIRVQDVFATEAIRYGIPGGFDEPGPAVAVKLGVQTGQFAPLILLAPTIVEKGESGGPVIYLFNVVGITRARHAQYPAFSFMTVGSAIRSLLAENSVRLSGHICNPVESNMIQTTLGPPANPVVASIKLDGRLTAENSSITPDLLNSFTKFNDKSITVKPSLEFKKSGVSIFGYVGMTQEQGEVESKVARATNDISQQLQETLWRSYVAEGEKAGKWKDAVIKPRAP